MATGSEPVAEPAADRAHWADRVEAVTIADSRLARTLAQPVKVARIGLLRRLGLTRPVAVPTFWGASFRGVLPEAVTALIWRFGVYEKYTTLFLLRHLREGGVFFDIGAHFGYFTMLASRLVGPRGKVVAIEAMPDTFAMLAANVEANRLDNVSLHQLAAGATEAKLLFHDFGVVNSSLNTSGAARGILSGTDARGREVTVDALPADEVLRRIGNPVPDLVKIDAESSEEAVLEGMAATLARPDAPIVLIELGGGDAEEDLRAQRIVATMAAAGYRPYLFDGRLVRPAEISGSVAYANLIFARPERWGPADIGAPVSLAAGKAVV